MQMCKRTATLHTTLPPSSLAVSNPCWRAGRQPLPPPQRGPTRAAPPRRLLHCMPQAEGGEWKQELMFKVPREHPEVQRLEGRYKK